MLNYKPISCILIYSWSAGMKHGSRFHAAFPLHVQKQRSCRCPWHTKTWDLLVQFEQVISSCSLQLVRYQVDMSSWGFDKMITIRATPFWHEWIYQTSLDLTQISLKTVFSCRTSGLKCLSLWQDERSINHRLIGIRSCMRWIPH